MEKQRFLAKIEKSKDGCWEWTGCCDSGGYGEFCLNRKQTRAHRAAWILFNGPIPEKMFVLHSCHKKSCVNPNHLFLSKQRCPLTLEKRFWSKVKKQKNEECWEWQASCDRKGYGQFSINRVMVRAHRVAWQILKGSIPEGKCVLHHCDNRKCVNPNHLFIGTVKDNQQDMVKKQRYALNCVKLKSHDIFEIRKKYASGNITQYQLAAEFKISQAQISEIVRGKHWKCVGGQIVPKNFGSRKNDN